MNRTVLEEISALVHRGGPWWLRWPVRLLVLCGVVACGFIPYDYQIGGDCKTVPVSQRGIRAQISDELVKVYVREGDQVKPGDLVAKLAVRDEQAAVATRSAELEKAKANLDLLRNGTRPEEISIAEQQVELWQAQLKFEETELARVKGLEENDAVAATEVADTQRKHDVSRSSLLAAQDNLVKLQRGPREEEIRAAEGEFKRIEAELAYNQQLVGLGDLLAPISGRVVTANIHHREGHYVNEGALIAVIHDVSEVRVEIAGDEAAALLVRVDMPVKIRLNGLDGRLLTGRVERIAPHLVDDVQFDVEGIRTDRESWTREAVQEADDKHVRLYVSLNEPDERLHPGMTGYAKIVIRSDYFWRALARPILRFFRVEVWSWLP